jgi:hypothetical protein
LGISFTIFKMDDAYAQLKNLKRRKSGTIAIILEGNSEGSNLR